ncbi:flagellar biosynthesis protein FlhB [Hahella sp. CCB-MM4]|uniref:EscU/YscU/HrcU family type III secretion system export apparatus switch protein n=1 Tax=Hahella sp. (strain CCB-MM4) TaxID=1926491 RepID=UPI000B9C2331|nr:EscU/YscU/HrcU family type III secretion system export apparatus switch protein [Hahella sp. CCB-MM4]OZG74855.1 flagellar biosynthesis protein FlhB [Hahella sp. CCB-MM4]
MAESQPDKSEKTEPPSPHKLQEARKKGGVAKSMEVSHVVGLLVSVVLLWSMAPELARDFLKVCSRLFDVSGSIPFDIKTVSGWSKWIVSEVVGILSPLFLMTMLAGVVAVLIQIGPVLSFHPVKPDIKRINPIEGFKRLVSIKILFELLKNVIKLLLLGTIIYYCVKSFLPYSFGLTQTGASNAIPFISAQLGSLILKLSIALIVISIADFLFVRREFIRNMRMTKKEVKDEIKRREGDPMVRSKRRELERELRKRSASVSSIENADVIITNPEHYAVVIKYDPQSMVAPKVTGKGVDAMALHLKAVARRHRVHIVEDPPLARYLYRKVGIDKNIPETAYMGVARALRKAYRLKRTLGGQTGTPYGAAI